MDIESLITELHTKRTERLSLQRKAELLEEEEKSLKAQIGKYMRAANRVVYEVGSLVCSYQESEEPFVEDWSKTIAYIKQTGSVDLLQKRLTMSAARARIAEEGSIPGVGIATKVTINVE